MKQKSLIFLMLLCAAISFSCGGSGGGGGNPNDPLSNFKVNQAELGEDWGQFKHDASFNCWNFGETRPREHRANPQAPRIFYDGEVTAEEHSIANDALVTMLGACRQDTNQWSPGNVWTKYVYFQEPKDYKIILVTSNYTIQEGEAAGCGGIITGAHGAYTAAGTVCGLNDRVNSSMPGSKGGVYIVVAKQTPEQLARTECKTLMKNAIRHEGEHVWFTNDSGNYFGHANDGNPPNGQGHPYCRGMVSSLLNKFDGFAYLARAP